METMKEAKNILIFPAFKNEDYRKINEPSYLILKIPETEWIKEIKFGGFHIEHTEETSYTYFDN